MPDTTPNFQPDTIPNFQVEEKQRITAEQALELAGYESELDIIDNEIKLVAEEGRRFIFLELKLLKKQSWLRKVLCSLQERGFKVENLTQPTVTKVSW